MSERWWLRPAAPLLAWCTSAEAEAAASKDADLEGGESGSGEQTLDGHWSGEAGDVEAGTDAEPEAEAAAEADAGADVDVLAGSRRPLNADRQPSEQQEQQQQDQEEEEEEEEEEQRQQQLESSRPSMPGPVQEAAGLACDAATFAVGGAVAAIGGAGAVTVEVVGAAVDAAGAAADYSRQQWERRSRQAAAAAAEPPPLAGPEASGEGSVDGSGSGR